MFAGANLGTYIVFYPYINKLVFDSTSVKCHLGALFLVNNAKHLSGASPNYVEIKLKKRRYKWQKLDGDVN
tara:strand:+ start:334 stop:546 length:213 start_codon:yes stop_codon:yes gene_type:complete